MKVGDYLVVKSDFNIPIRSGDGIVDNFDVKKYDRFLITDINDKEIEIKYKNYHVTFLINDVKSYLLECYKLYFYDFLISNRKDKLELISKKWS